MYCALFSYFAALNALAQNEIFCLYQKVMFVGGDFCTLYCFWRSQVDACDLFHTQYRWGPECGAIKGIAGRQFVTDLMRRTRKFEKGSAPFFSSSSLSWSTLSTLSSLSCSTTSSWSSWAEWKVNGHDLGGGKDLGGGGGRELWAGAREMALRPGKFAEK